MNQGFWIISFAVFALICYARPFFPKPHTIRILVVHTSSLGDIVHTLPAISNIARHVLGAQIDRVAEEAFAEIPSSHPVLNELLTMAHRH